MTEEYRVKVIRFFTSTEILRIRAATPSALEQKIQERIADLQHMMPKSPVIQGQIVEAIYAKQTAETESDLSVLNIPVKSVETFGSIHDDDRRTVYGVVTADQEIGTGNVILFDDLKSLPKLVIADAASHWSTKCDLINRIASERRVDPSSQACPDLFRTARMKPATDKKTPYFELEPEEDTDPVAY
jgi:hypothetical protein